MEVNIPCYSMLCETSIERKYSSWHSTNSGHGFSRVIRLLTPWDISKFPGSSNNNLQSQFIERAWRSASGFITELFKVYVVQWRNDAQSAVETVYVCLYGRLPLFVTLELLNFTYCWLESFISTQRYTAAPFRDCVANAVGRGHENQPVPQVSVSQDSSRRLRLRPSLMHRTSSSANVRLHIVSVRRRMPAEHLAEGGHRAKEHKLSYRASWR